MCLYRALNSIGKKFTLSVGAKKGKEKGLTSRKGLGIPEKAM